MPVAGRFVVAALKAGPTFVLRGREPRRERCLPSNGSTARAIYWHKLTVVASLTVDRAANAEVAPLRCGEWVALQVGVRDVAR